MRYIRSHAAEYGVDPNKVGAMGFSAGGDLCLRAGLSDDPLVKPNFLCPVYPAVRQPPHSTFQLLLTHGAGTPLA